jgi:hypothetical protein
MLTLIEAIVIDTVLLLALRDTSLGMGNAAIYLLNLFFLHITQQRSTSSSCQNHQHTFSVLSQANSQVCSPVLVHRDFVYFIFDLSCINNVSFTAVILHKRTVPSTKSPPPLYSYTSFSLIPTLRQCLLGLIMLSSYVYIQGSPFFSSSCLSVLSSSSSH